MVYQAMLESAASELAARMDAMTNASNIALELIGSLTLAYNKARQASITQELLEIVGASKCTEPRSWFRRLNKARIHGEFYVAL